MGLQRHEQSEDHAKTDPCISLELAYTAVKARGGYRQLWREVQKLDSIFTVWYSARGLPSGSEAPAICLPPCAIAMPRTVMPTSRDEQNA